VPGSASLFIIIKKCIIFVLEHGVIFNN